MRFHEPVRRYAAARALARSASALKAAASRTARSASIFRSMLTPAFRNPLINRLWDRPASLAAALMRTIQ